jgi:hypothetical protein
MIPLPEECAASAWIDYNHKTTGTGAMFDVLIISGGKVVLVALTSVRTGPEPCYGRVRTRIQKFWGWKSG